MAQLVARLNGIQKVRGSNPLSSTTFHIVRRDIKCSDYFFRHTRRRAEIMIHEVIIQQRKVMFREMKRFKQKLQQTEFAIKELGEKYYPNHNNELQNEIEKFKTAFLIIRFDIEHITGKQSKELL